MSISITPTKLVVFCFDISLLMLYRSESINLNTKIQYTKKRSKHAYLKYLLHYRLTWNHTKSGIISVFLNLNLSQNKKWSFPWRISSVNATVTVTLMENFIFCAVFEKIIATENKRSSVAVGILTITMMLQIEFHWSWEIRCRIWPIFKIHGKRILTYHGQ